MTKLVTREKISATVDREMLARARQLVGCTGTSEVLDRALQALIASEVEARWHAGYERLPAGEEIDPVGEVGYADIGLDQ